MRNRFTILMALILVGMFSVPSIGATFSVLGGPSVIVQDCGEKSENFDKKIGVNVGLEFAPTEHFSVISVGDRTPIGSSVYRNDIAVYVAFGLREFGSFMVKGLVGPEWNSTNESNFDFAEPGFAFGLWVSTRLFKGVGGHVMATTVLAGDSASAKLRGGLSYSLF